MSAHVGVAKETRTKLQDAMEPSCLPFMALGQVYDPTSLFTCQALAS